MRTVSAQHVRSHLSLKNIFWGKPSAVAIFCALISGYIGGSIPLFSPPWFIWLLIVACLRVHIPLTLISFSVALILGYFLDSLYISIGNVILTSAPSFWTNLLARPGVRLLDLHHADIIGPLVSSAAFSFIPAIILARVISSHSSHSKT